tara:strand:- start:677 stop:1162 length:486 start_codon:yes stop_codon:yes gene_type:complete
MSMEIVLSDLLDTYTRLVNSGDCGNWDPETDDVVIRARAALEGIPAEEELIRLMLGIDGQPHLLVEVTMWFEGRNRFDFYVVNGDWHGEFDHGSMIVIFGEENKAEPRKGYAIICDDQDRLRGEYQTVFNNYGNSNYISPPEKPREKDDDWNDYFDDDIPF